MRDATRRMTAAAAALAIFVFVAPAAAVTRVSEYSPFNAGGDLRAGLQAVPAFGGSCRTGSFLARADDAYRCFSGIVIRDPCFLDEKQGSSSRSVVVCVESPWSTNVVRLRVTGAFSGARGVGPGEAPWGVRLASGRRCVRIAGVTARVMGRQITYACSGHRWLLGAPNRVRPTWTIQQIREPTDRRPRRVEIAHAWK